MGRSREEKGASGGTQELRKKEGKINGGGK